MVGGVEGLPMPGQIVGRRFTIHGISLRCGMNGIHARAAAHANRNGYGL